MQLINTGYRALGLLSILNWDRGLALFTLAIALAFGAWIGTL